jgi:hypothetical protein
MLTTYNQGCSIHKEQVVINAKIITCGLYFTGAHLVIRDSRIYGTVHNGGSGQITIVDTTINGGSDHSESVGGNNITILRSNLEGDQHEFHCGSNCTLKNSWLHDNYNGASLGWHQNGFLTNGGANFTIVHNSVYCVGGCTSDIAFIPDANVSHAYIDKNLLVATADASYCLYPSSDHPRKPGIVSQITVTDNVFQHGPKGECAQYGPVYGWNRPNTKRGTDGYGNVWSGNKWDNGKALSP